MNKNHGSFYRWGLLFLLFWAFFFHQADRAIFGVVVSEIQKDLHLNDTQIGLTASVLFFMLAIMVPVAGFAGDRFSKKKVITGSIIFWSLSTMLTGLSTGLWSLITFRSVATAGGESFYAPAATSLIATYHKKTRSIALAIHQSSLYIGVIVSGFVAGWIADNYGWRVTFCIFGGIGFFIGLSFIFLLHDPPTGQAARELGLDTGDDSNPNEHDLASTTDSEAGAESANTALQTDSSLSTTPPTEKEPVPTIAQTFKTLLSIPSVPLLTMGFIAIVFVNNAYVVWAPKFLAGKFGLDLTSAGGFSMFYHHIAALGAILLGGVATDAVVAHRPSFRVHLQWITMLLGVPVIFWMGMSPKLSDVYLMMFLFGALRGLYETNTHASIFDVVKPKMRASIVGLMVMTAFLIGSTSPIILGWLGDLYKDEPAKGLSYGFACLSISWLIGGIAVLLCALFTFKRDRIK